MMNTFRVINFIKNYYKSPRFLFFYCLHFLSPSFKQNFRFFNMDEFSKEILSGRSFIRIGDGETGFINGTGPLFYQKQDKDLSKILKDIIKNYSSTSSYILGLPQEFINRSNNELRELDRFYCYYQVKVTASLLFPKNVLYGDTILFYYGDRYLKIFLDYIRDKRVIFVSNKETISRWTELKTPFFSISYIEGDKKDAFTAYRRLIKKIEEEIDNDEKNDRPVLLLSLGPTGKALAYYFSERGITCYDIGVGAEILFQQKNYSDRI